MIHTHKMTFALLILSFIHYMNASEKASVPNMNASEKASVPITLIQGIGLTVVGVVASHIPTICSFIKKSYSATTPTDIKNTINQLTEVEEKIERLIPSIVQAPTNNSDDFKRFTQLSIEKRRKNYSQANHQSLLECLTKQENPDLSLYNPCLDHLNAVAKDKENNISEDDNTN